MIHELLLIFGTVFTALGLKLGWFRVIAIHLGALEDAFRSLILERHFIFTHRTMRPVR